MAIAALLRHGLQHREHFRLNIDCVHLAGGSDKICNASRVVARSRADVGKGTSRRWRQDLQQQIAALFALTLFPLEPCRALKPHHVGDLSPHVRLADTIGIRRYGLIARLVFFRDRRRPTRDPATM